MQGERVFTSPREIEKESMRIIRQELDGMGILIREPELDVVMRTIHTTADFDFAKNMVFLNDAVSAGRQALGEGRCIVTDTNMALSGISRPFRGKFGIEANCYMADPEIANTAVREGITRARAAMTYASGLHPDAVYVIGNAPTALIRINELIREKILSPALVVGVPVGFVNVSESKEMILETCDELGIPAIIARGRKGGSTVAAAIVNALLYGIIPAAAK